MQKTFTTIWIWILVGVIFLLGQAYSQSRAADISIVNPQVNGTTFSFEVHLSPTPPNGMGNATRNGIGSSSWFFNYNSAALTNPVLSFSGTSVDPNFGYSSTVGSNSGAGKVFITTSYDNNFDGVLLTTGQDYHVYTVSMTISDPNQQAGITWDQTNSAIFNLGDQEVTENYSGNGDVTLPVELSAFSATAAEGKVILSWATQSEVNNLGFEVYRAQEEAGNYTMIASYESNAALQGAGNSNEEIEYQYEDASIYPGATFWYQIADVDFAGVRTFHGPIQAEALEALPTAYALRNNYPNPFNPSTTIRFEVPANVNDRMEIVVYNALGMKLKTLVSGRVQAGVHEVVWDGTSQQGVQMASGVYFIRMAAGKFNQVHKMILLK